MNQQDLYATLAGSTLDGNNLQMVPQAQWQRMAEENRRFRESVQRAYRHWHEHHREACCALGDLLWFPDDMARE